MSTALLAPSLELEPALIERAGKRTLLRFVEFFAVSHFQHEYAPGLRARLEDVSRLVRATGRC